MKDEDKISVNEENYTPADRLGSPRPAQDRLIHYSAKLLTKLEPVELGTLHNGKPHGFWFSVEGEDDWKSWCEAESFHLESLAYPHEVVLAPAANILRLTNAFDIDLFTEQFSKPCEWSSTRRDIDWLKVANIYQGIIIAPYIWQRRMSEHTFWYYGWDCASGCVWDIRAVQSVTPSDSEATE